MNKVQKLRKIKHRKPIKYESLLTFLEIGKANSLASDKRLNNATKNASQIVSMRDSIIAFAKQPEDQINEKQIQELLCHFLQLKYSLKFINIERVKKSSKKSALKPDHKNAYEDVFCQQLTPVISQNYSSYRHQASSEGADKIFDDYSLEPPLPLTSEGQLKTVLEQCMEGQSAHPAKEEFDHLLFL